MLRSPLWAYRTHYCPGASRPGGCLSDLHTLALNHHLPVPCLGSGPGGMNPPPYGLYLCASGQLSEWVARHLLCYRGDALCSLYILASAATARIRLTAGEPGLRLGTGLPTLANGRLTWELSGPIPHQRHCLIFPQGEIKHVAERSGYLHVSSVS